MDEYTKHKHDQRAFSCTHVVDDGAPILLVCHDHDGDWQFLCGGDDHYDSNGVRVVCCECLFKKDGSLKGIETLDVGFSAERASAESNSWVVEVLPPDEEE